MKTRKELAFLKHELTEEITERINEHDCHSYKQEGMSCMLCSLLLLKKPFALLQYLRTIGFYNKTLKAEQQLIDFLGEKDFKLKIKTEMKLVRNMPKKKCFNCQKVVGLWMPYSVAAIYLHYFKKQLRTTCCYCGEKILFTKEEFKLINRNNTNQDTLEYAVNLVSRFGYSPSDEIEMMYDPNEEEE